MGMYRCGQGGIFFWTSLPILCSRSPCQLSEQQQSLGTQPRMKGQLLVERALALRLEFLTVPPRAEQGTGVNCKSRSRKQLSLESWHLHLPAVPHASLGMEVMEEVPEGDPFHFQACLEDPVQQLPVFPSPAVPELLGVHASDFVQV